MTEDDVKQMFITKELCGIVRIFLKEKETNHNNTDIEDDDESIYSSTSSALIVDLQFNKEKYQSTRLPYEYYCCFQSPEHINYIVIGEFERACRTFAMLSDAEYEAPTIHTLLFNLNIPGIEVLLAKEFKLKQYSNNDIMEFDKLEQQ